MNKIIDVKKELCTDELTRLVNDFLSLRKSKEFSFKDNNFYYEKENNDNSNSLTIKSLEFDDKRKLKIVKYDNMIVIYFHYGENQLHLTMIENKVIPSSIVFNNYFDFDCNYGFKYYLYFEPKSSFNKVTILSNDLEKFKVNEKIDRISYNVDCGKISGKDISLVRFRKGIKINQDDSNEVVTLFNAMSSFDTEGIAYKVIDKIYSNDKTKRYSNYYNQDTLRYLLLNSLDNSIEDYLRSFSIININGNNYLVNGKFVKERTIKLLEKMSFSADELKTIDNTLKKIIQAEKDKENLYHYNKEICYVKK